MARAKSGVRTGAEAFCKCGWHGSTWFGPGQRQSAWSEYRWHQDRCPLNEDAQGQRAFERAMGMSGYAGSPAEREDRAEGEDR